MSYKEYKTNNGDKIVEAIKEILKEEQLDYKDNRHFKVHQRYYLMWFAREHSTLSLAAIGHLFGRKHDNVIHAIRQHNFHTANIHYDRTYTDNTSTIKDYLFEQFPSLFR
jgi:chromosomal replication initiation ATPase DnaA